MGEERQGGHTTPPGQKFTVSEVAGTLGISAEAVRSRIKRGTLRSVKDGPTVYVLLDTDQTRPDTDQTPPEPDRTGAQTTDPPDHTAALLEQMQAEISYLREQLDAERQARTEERRRADTVIAQLTSRIPQLEAPPAEPQGGQEMHGEPGRVVVRRWQLLRGPQRAVLDLSGMGLMRPQKIHRDGPGGGGG